MDKSKEESADIKQKQSLEITQDQDSVSLDKGLTTQEDAIKRKSLSVGTSHLVCLMMRI